MKTSSIVFAATVALSGFASAQKKSDYFPECSLDCLNDATKKATDCDLEDAVCWCVQANYEAIYTAGYACVIKACGNDVAIQEVLPAAEGFCLAASAAASSSAAPKTTSAPKPSSTESSKAGVTPPASTPSSGGDDEINTSTTEVSTTESPGAAAATGYIGGVAMLALGALAAL